MKKPEAKKPPASTEETLVHSILVTLLKQKRDDIKRCEMDIVRLKKQFSALRVAMECMGINTDE